MNKKTILFILNKECTYLPPFMTILDALSDKYSLKVISREKKSGKQQLEDLYKGKDVSFISSAVPEKSRNILSRVIYRIRTILHFPSGFHKEAVDLLTTPCDLLWVIHEETALEFKKKLQGQHYILSLYELNDHRLDFLEKIRTVIQNAQEVIVPEYNRACILRVWMKLDKTPTVIPNKPLNHPKKQRIPNSYSAQLGGKKIVLYQGYINRSRNLDKICEAVKDIPGYCIVLMGKGDTSYINELIQKYPQIIHISFIAPPEHLYVTSWAHLAIVKYDYVYLNAIYCAPNKTWEYTGFGIPVLGHNIPGLEYTIGKYNAGVCADLDDVGAIHKAIETIDSNYEFYRKNALLYYDSCDIKSELLTIAQRRIHE